MLEKIRRIFKSTDKKPVLVSFVLQRDECSRLLGEFGEKELSNCKALIITWQDGNNDLRVITSDSLTDAEAAGMLLIAANTIGKDNGI